jgi:signal transduction histidine kinase
VAEELLREKLKRGELDDWNRYLNDMREDIEVLDDLIGRILTLSKLDIHERTIHAVRIDLRAMLEELLSKLRSAAEKKALNLDVRLGDGLHVDADQDAFQSALSNIIDNAIKFSPDRGNVRLEANAEQRTLKIKVTNTSAALPEDDLVKIFEPFYRSKSSREPGYGLGLAIAKRAVEKQGGKIEATNSPEGFCVTISLPVALSDGV